MQSVFEEKTKFQKMLDVEAALTETLAEEGMIPEEDAEKISGKAEIEQVSVDRIREIEKETGHETMSLVLALAEASGEAGRYVHFGATSNDILDTGLSLQLKEASNIIETRISNLIEILAEKAEEHKDTTMVGRTHGQHATPTTLGMKFALWGDELKRHLERLEELKSRVLVGQMSGAVGTGAAWGDKGSKIQRRVMEKLGLEPVEISNQIIQRDRHSELINFLGLLGSTMAKIGREIRNLQRTEISEVSEPFREEEQVGSSTMPQKRNPIKSERVCGLARILRSNVQAALENVVLEHERDLTNSSPERILFPECFLLADQMISDLTGVLDNLVIRSEMMKKNLELTKGLNMSEAVMVELTKHGMGRQEAHEALRKASNYAVENETPLREALKKNKKLLNIVSEDEIEDLLDPEKYLGSAEKTVEEIVSKLRELNEN